MRDTRRKATTRPKVDSKVGETREESRSNTVVHTGCPPSQSDQVVENLRTPSANGWPRRGSRDPGDPAREGEKNGHLQVEETCVADVGRSVL